MVYTYVCTYVYAQVLYISMCVCTSICICEQTTRRQPNPLSLYSAATETKKKVQNTKIDKIKFPKVCAKIWEPA